MSDKPKRVSETAEAYAPIGTATYRCMACSFSWHQKPGHAVCPKCEHHLVEWTNYPEWYAINGHEVRKQLVA